MTFTYQKITPKISRPLIYIIVKSTTRFTIYPVLIDSGADYCIFSLELASDLGLNLSESKVGFKGVGKDKVMGRWGEVDIRVGDVTYQTKVLFADIGKFGHGILGQIGFFDHFDVKLRHSKQIIEVEPIKLSN